MRKLFTKDVVKFIDSTLQICHLEFILITSVWEILNIPSKFVGRLSTSLEQIPSLESFRSLHSAKQIIGRQILRQKLCRNAYHMSLETPFLLDETFIDDKHWQKPDFLMRMISNFLILLFAALKSKAVSCFVECYLKRCRV